MTRPLENEHAESPGRPGARGSPPRCRPSASPFGAGLPFRPDRGARRSIAARLRHSSTRLRPHPATTPGSSTGGRRMSAVRSRHGTTHQPRDAGRRRPGASRRLLPRRRRLGADLPAGQRGVLRPRRDDPRPVAPPRARRRRRHRGHGSGAVSRLLAGLQRPLARRGRRDLRPSDRTGRPDRQGAHRHRLGRLLRLLRRSRRPLLGGRLEPVLGGPRGRARLVRASPASGPWRGCRVRLGTGTCHRSRGLSGR